jgi:hypothetical protein
MFARLAILAALAFLLLAPARAASIDGLAVDVANLSEPVLCAEKDNVTLTFASPEARRFQIKAVHPSYMGGLNQDSWHPDFTACGDLTEASTKTAPPVKETLYETMDLWVVGFRFANFWRPNQIPLRIGDEVVTGYDLIQLWIRHEERAEEVLVLYPGDGYWRLRPLPPRHLGWSAYGSSLLIGPVEQDGRPVVNIKSVAFDPKTRAFTLDYAAGGSARVTLSKLDREEAALDVVFDAPVRDKPFAALRSMYVTEFNADAARVAARAPGAEGWIEAPIMGFKGGKATDVWAGRLVHSRHNTSAPDTIFRAFKDR